MPIAPLYKAPSLIRWVPYKWGITVVVEASLYFYLNNSSILDIYFDTLKIKGTKVVTFKNQLGWFLDYSISNFNLKLVAKCVFTVRMKLERVVRINSLILWHCYSLFMLLKAQEYLMVSLESWQVEAYDWS